MEWPAVLVLFVWDLEQLLCLFFPDLANNMEKEGTNCAFFFFFF